MFGLFFNPKEEKLMSEVKFKTIRVRPGCTGFYNKILVAGEVARIPADMEATKDGWFDDVSDDAVSTIGAARVGQKEISTQDADTSEGPNPNVGNPEYVPPAEDQFVSSDVAPESADSDQAQGTEGQVDSDGDKDATTKKLTKAEIIAELEKMGVEDIDRNARVADLQARLDLVKNALGE